MNKIANMHVASSTAGSLSRRSLFKLGGLATAVAAGASLAGCAPQPKSASMADTGSGATRAADGTPSFLIAPEPITEFDETRDFEVVVVGAGVSGMAAAMSAAEAGAKIACVQREATPSSQGNMAAGVDLNQTSEAGKQALISYLIKLADHRSNRALLEAWADNSFEALSWFREAASAGGIEVNPDEPQADRVLHISGYDVYLHANTYFRIGHDEVVKAIAPIAESAGVEFFFSCPTQQLVTDESGRVTGVVCEEDGKNVLFNASKGVILATGDYQNDDDMMAYYLPDLQNLGRKQMNKTGDGHKMAVWAGGAIEDITHTKMLHDFDGGPGSMADMPFLAVKNDGTRFCDETLGMSLMNNFLRSEADQGDYNQIFDSNYMTAAAEWPGKLFDPEAIKVYMPEEDGEKSGVFKDQIATFKADTLEELAEKLGITDTAAFVESVKRYNECVAAGKDLDFGKEAKWLTAIDTPPFYGIHRHVRVSAVVSGVNVGPNMEVLAVETNEPIPGLFAIGNTAGNFYGGVDYSMYMPGLSLGRAHTQGYVTGKYVASL